jgi:hypothetical protein
LGAIALVSAPASATPVTLQLVSDSDGKPLPGRFHVKDAAGKAQRADPLPFWFDHFVCDGTARLELSPGEYTYEAERGPEYSAAQGRFTVQAGMPTNVLAGIHRIADLAREDWWSGETHVHRPLADTELLMRAEDLHVAEVITWWNKVNPWTNTALPQTMPIRFDDDRFYHPLGGEDERDGGALLYFNLSRPLEITRGTRHSPSSFIYALQAKLRAGTWIDIEKPFWWDFPMWVANDIGHSVGLANNHQQRGGMLDSEAWGRPRERGAFAGARGNGLYTQEIYYRLLNCGLRLPPSAGSASGVLPNPVGYNRVYVHVDAELTYEKWCEGLRAGRSFVSNGPLLRCRANGQFPGHVFTATGPVQIQIEGRLASRDPIEVVELVHPGGIERIQLPATYTARESGWFLVRAIATPTNTFRFASTAPWYVEIGNQPMRPRAEAAAFFVDWCRDRQRQLQERTELTAEQKKGVLQPWDRALAFWQDKALAAGTRLTGRVVDASTDQPLPARLYIEDDAGRWFFAASAAPEGSAVRYDRQSGVSGRAVDKHTTLSAHPFQIQLAPGRYRLTVERGKEYLTTTQEVTVGRQPVDVRLPLRRWANMAARGWYSGDAHVHRNPVELPNVILAEDVNVALPMVYWTTADDVPPNQSQRNFKGEFPAAPVPADATHVYYPRNTEYEIFSTAKRTHTLGALVVVNHKTVLDLPVLPVSKVAERAHAEGALIDLEKHNWEWSMAVVPIVHPDLYELANNHLWRTEYTVTNWAAPAPAWMKVGHGRGTERDWALYGFQNYYALLNCGFRLRPSAGTANGVHPVPLGFSRVYVHLDGPFSYEAWIKGLGAGRSFVSTGPMLLATVDGRDPGHLFKRADARPHPVTVQGSVFSAAPVSEVEVIVNGDTIRRIPLQSKRTAEGGYEASFSHREPVAATGWVAVRCWEQNEPGRWRFAHTGPVWFETPGQAPRPRHDEIAFLIARTREEIERSRALLPAEALAEYQKALQVYEELAKSAR